MVDLDDNCLEIVVLFGVIYKVNFLDFEKVIKEIYDLIDGCGVDVVIEVVGIFVIFDFC